MVQYHQDQPIALAEGGRATLTVSPTKPSHIDRGLRLPEPGYKVPVSTCPTGSDSDHSGSDMIGSQPPNTYTTQRKQCLPSPSTNDTPRAAWTANPNQTASVTSLSDLAKGKFSHTTIQL